MKRILLVEDNPADVELVREALASIDLQFILDVAVEFEQARDYVKNVASGVIRLDLLLMDLNLLKGSGFDLLEIIRSGSENQTVPVIIVSSSNSERDRNRAVSLGASAYFPKPTNFEEFMKLGPLVLQSFSDSAG